MCSVQVNIAAESGEMGVLANHVPSIEQLKPGLVEVIEESGGSKQFFRTFCSGFEIYNRYRTDRKLSSCSIWRVCDCSTRL